MTAKLEVLFLGCSSSMRVKHPQTLEKRVKPNVFDAVTTNGDRREKQGMLI